jgi:hypothetical protein
MAQIGCQAEMGPSLSITCTSCPRMNIPHELRTGRKGRAAAKAASATGTDHAQSLKIETAAAATTQPTRKPTNRCRDLFNRPASSGNKARRFDRRSINDKTVLVKLPVITAVEIAPGIAKRRRVYWQAIAETAIITAMPAANPC